METTNAILRRSHQRAVEAYRYYGLRLRVPMSQEARTVKARNLRAATIAGLADVQAARDYVPLRYIDDAANFRRWLQHRREAYALQRQRELAE